MSFTSEGFATKSKKSVSVKPVPLKVDSEISSDCSSSRNLKLQNGKCVCSISGQVYTTAKPYTAGFCKLPGTPCGSDLNGSIQTDGTCGPTRSLY